jgi:hypothetical protein
VSGSIVAELRYVRSQNGPLRNPGAGSGIARPSPHAGGRAPNAERTARDALVAEGIALLRGELPRLLRDPWRLRRDWHRLQAGCEAIGQSLGPARFVESA